MSNVRFIFPFISLILMVHGEPNRLIIEKAGVVEANTEYFSYADVHVDVGPDGKYELAGNFELIQDMPNKTLVIGRIKNFIDNKYEPVGSTDGKNLCSFMRDEFHDWFSDEYLEGQHWFDKCPVNKGSYWFKQFTPKYIEYPVANLWSKSLSEIIFTFNGEILLHIKWYATLLKTI